MGQERNLSWIRRHWLLITLLIVIVIAIVSGFLTFQYSSVWGPTKTQENKIQNQFTCPQLSNMTFYDYTTTENYAPDGTSLGRINTSTWVVQTVDYSTKDEKITYTSQQGYGDDENISVIFCENGSTMNENEGNDLDPEAGKYNPNYTYCGNFVMPIVLYKLDSSGNMVNNTTSVQIVFDSKTKSYVTTRCGTYDTVNAL